MKYSRFLGLKLPEQEDFYNVDDFNSNSIIIEENIDQLHYEAMRRVINAGYVPSIQAGLDASKPVPGTAGRLYVATDTQIIYRDTGTAWQKVGVVNWNDIAGKPTSFMPTAHKSTHATGGTDALTPADIGAAREADLAAHLADTLKHQRSATIVVAASNSSADGKAAAQYVCDGVSDEDEINAALSALGAVGGMVLLLEGTYIVDGPINVPSKATLAGQGWGTVIKIKNALNADINVVQNANQTNGDKNIVLRDFAIDGNEANNTSRTQNGVHLYKVTYSLIYRLLVTNCRNYGIDLYSGSNNTITGNTCQGNSQSGIYLSLSSNNTVTGNTCQGNSQSGIYLYSGSNNNTITGNTCQGNSQNGIDLYSVSNNTVTGNTCQGNSQNGIYLSLSSNNTVTGNTCLENSQASNAAQDNIHITSDSSYNNVQTNTCRAGKMTNKPRYGICIYTNNCNGNLVTNNDLYQGGVTGAFSDSGTGTITTAGNRVS